MDVLKIQEAKTKIIGKQICYREEKEKDINDTIESAKKQIEERKYEENLQEKGFKNITKMVFAFKGKEVKMQIV